MGLSSNLKKNISHQILLEGPHWIEARQQIDESLGEPL